MMRENKRPKTKDQRPKTGNGKPKAGRRKLFWFISLSTFCLLISATGFAQEEGLIEILRFKDADIRVVLKAITQKAIKDGKRVNILVAPGVKGLITVDLQSVDWKTALEAVLKTYDYGYEWVGKNIVLVDTLERLAEKRAKAAEAQVAEPLETKAFTLNFAKVEEVQEPVRGMLSPRGKITFDSRTNTLVVTDTQTSVAALTEVITTLDKITPQVLIEARIIETDLDVSDKIGVKWNIGTTAGEASTIVSGAKTTHIWPFTASSDNKYLPDPTSVASTFSYGSLDASSLSVALQILFEDTNTKILSQPKITTLDNHTAIIKVITKYPVPTYTYNSENAAFEISGFKDKEYGVILEVTPQINKEGFVTLTVEPDISENIGSVSFTSGGSGSIAKVPIISTQTTSTKVMIMDGETLVIGGLVRDKTIETINKIPVLGDIPVLGFFFKHKAKTVVKKNLMIFITATIVTPQLIKAEE